jgi:hypothetical protein
MHKAIAAFLMSLVTLLAAFGVDASGWATPNLIEAVSAVLGALATGFMTWLIPNKPKA